MQARKTWFAGLCIFLYVCGSIYTLLSGLSTLGEGREYPYLYPALVIIAISGALFAAVLVASVSARLQLPAWAAKHPLGMTVLEWGLAAAILLASFIIRIIFIQQFPMEPSSDYKTYYEIAKLINSDTLLVDGVGYCEYISMFPHVYGYSYVLSIALRIFGDSVWTGQMLNVVCALIACFFVWRCSIMLAGRASGLIALAVSAFWPSQILYNNMLAAEYVFSAMFFFCMWFFLRLVYVDISSGRAQSGLFIKHIVLGVCIGLTSAIRPMAMLLLISILLYLVPSKAKLPVLNYNDLPVSARAMSHGWVRALLILVAFMFTTSITTRCVSYAVDREITTGSASYGYNLLVGLNQDSYGGWNQDDANYLYDALADTGSAQQAQAACRDLAVQRLKTPLASILNLFFHKYSVLWANDDYGSTWNLLFMGQQDTLTSERETFLYSARNFNNYYYLIAVAFSALGVIMLIRRPGTWAYVPVTVFLGTVAMHLLVENQNRYHFHALYLFVMLLAAALHYIYEACDDYIVHGQADRTLMQQQNEIEQLAYKRIEEAIDYAQQRQQKAMEGGQFDMASALNDGHVRVSVSQAVSETHQLDNNPPVAEQAAAPVVEAAKPAAPAKAASHAKVEKPVAKRVQKAEASRPAKTVKVDSTPAKPVETTTYTAPAVTVSTVTPEETIVVASTAEAAPAVETPVQNTDTQAPEKKKQSLSFSFSTEEPSFMDEEPRKRSLDDLYTKPRH